MLTMVFAALGVFVGLEQVVQTLRMMLQAQLTKMMLQAQLTKMMLQAQLTKMMQACLKKELLPLRKAKKVG